MVAAPLVNTSTNILISGWELILFYAKIINEKSVLRRNQTWRHLALFWYYKLLTVFGAKGSVFKLAQYTFQILFVRFILEAISMRNVRYVTASKSNAKYALIKLFSNDRHFGQNCFLSELNL